MVIRPLKMECDKQMAKRKGYLPCERKCEICHACVITNKHGDREHVNLLSPDIVEVAKWTKKYY